MARKAASRMSPNAKSAKPKSAQLKSTKPKSAKPKSEPAGAGKAAPTAKTGTAKTAGPKTGGPKTATGAAAAKAAADTAPRPSARSPGRPKGSTNAKPPAKPPAFDKQQEFHALRDMLLIRRFEEKAGQMYGMGLIGGFCHLYIGQEAVIVGMMMCVKQGDQIITGYRDHGHMLATGMDPGGVMAELTGREGGYSHGKGGSMHMFSVEKNFYGGHGIVGAPVPLGTGLAFSNKYRGNDHVSLTFFGDGAANQGQVYEAFNMAKLWKLPVVYVIENNKYAMGTSIERSAATTDLSHRGRSFDIPGEQVDGMNVHAVKAAGDAAIARVRAGEGPYILEMLTYRYRGHSMSDPAKYRSREEVQSMRAEHDPIEMVRKRLIDNGWADEAALKQIDAEVRERVSAAEKFATESPEPDPSELWTDIVAVA